MNGVFLNWVFLCQNWVSAFLVFIMQIGVFLAILLDILNWIYGFDRLLLQIDDFAQIFAYIIECFQFFECCGKRKLQFDWCFLVEQSGDHGVLLGHNPQNQQNFPAESYIISVLFKEWMERVVKLVGGCTCYVARSSVHRWR